MTFHIAIVEELARFPVPLSNPLRWLAVDGANILSVLIPGHATMVKEASTIASEMAFPAT